MSKTKSKNDWIHHHNQQVIAAHKQLSIISEIFENLPDLDYRRVYASAARADATIGFNVEYLEHIKQYLEVLPRVEMRLYKHVDTFIVPDCRLTDEERTPEHARYFTIFPVHFRYEAGKLVAIWYTKAGERLVRVEVSITKGFKAPGFKMVYDWATAQKLNYLHGQITCYYWYDNATEAAIFKTVSTVPEKT